MDNDLFTMADDELEAHIRGGWSPLEIARRAAGSGFPFWERQCQEHAPSNPTCDTCRRYVDLITLDRRVQAVCQNILESLEAS